ncbi:MAG: hypothetical protein WA463_05215 [Terriglobales bacterium]
MDKASAPRPAIAACQRLIRKKGFFALPLLIASCCALCAAPSGPASSPQNAATRGPGVDPAISAGLDADAKSDVQATAKYAAAIRALFKQAKFKQLEAIAASARSEKSRFAGGTWKLYAFYRALQQPAEGREAPDQAWEMHLERLSMWAASDRSSATARIALAEANLKYAERIRIDANNTPSNAPHRSTDDDPWEVINQSTHVTEVALKEAADLGAKDPHWYFVEQELKHGGDKELLDKAIALEPSYYANYRLHALFLHPKWDGQEGAPEKFADEISAQIGGKEGLVAYFEVAETLSCGPSSITKPKLSWEKIQLGYAALEELYGSSMIKLNQYACLAVLQSDMTLAQQLFARIGDNWDEHTWRSRNYFESSRALTMAPAEIRTLRAATDSNMATPEGGQYFQQISAEFKQKQRWNFMDCARPMGQNLGGSFDLFLKFAPDGTLQEVKAWPQTKFSACIIPKVSGSFTPPPRPEYWVKFSMYLP